MNNKSKTVCFVAGKSGGHIIPCLTQAREIKKRYPTYKTVMMTTNATIDKKILAQAGDIDTHVILNVESVPYKKIVRYPMFFIQLCIAFVKSFYYLIKMRPYEIITTGGYVAIPVSIAAKILRIPVQLQLLDVMPGRTISFLAPIARSITICFEQSKEYLPAHKCISANYPVRFAKSSLQRSSIQAQQALGIDTQRFTLCVMGGSQGSLTLNILISQWIEAHPELHDQIQVIHQTGSLDKHDWQEFYQRLAIPAYVFQYHDQLDICYQASDVVICRAGAGTLFEVTFFNKPIITIPLQCATTTHQTVNARAFQEKYPELCTIIEQQAMPLMVEQLHARIRDQIAKELKSESHRASEHQASPLLH